jgi:hypothetical protein
VVENLPTALTCSKCAGNVQDGWSVSSDRQALEYFVDRRERLERCTNIYQLQEVTKELEAEG